MSGDIRIPKFVTLSEYGKDQSDHSTAAYPGFKEGEVVSVRALSARENFLRCHAHFCHMRALVGVLKRNLARSRSN